VNGVKHLYSQTVVYQDNAMFLINFPLMIIPFAIYDFFIIADEQDPWNDAVTVIATAAGTSFAITLGHVLIGVALLLLVVEALKSRCAEISTTLDHILSCAVLLAAVAEFHFIARAATPTFFLLMMVALTSLTANLLLSRRRGSGRLTIEG
jgi:hypothetical protein